jgi:DNA-binding XRE family transcriptional regulator
MSWLFTLALPGSGGVTKMIKNQMLCCRHYLGDKAMVTASMTARPVVPNDLAEFRRQYGLSQRACGTLLGVEQSVIRRWETGQMRIEKPVLLALALEGARQVLAERCRADQDGAAIARKP